MTNVSARWPFSSCFRGLCRCLGMWLLCCVAWQAAGAQGSAVLNGETLGQSLRLSRWAAAPGNDPRWASPDFVDRSWTPLGSNQELPANWGQPRSLWYRVQVRVPLRCPPVAVYVEHLFYNYAVYANGVEIGRQGQMDGKEPTRLHPAEGFQIPAKVLDAADGRLAIALHVVSGPVGFLGYSAFSAGTRVELVSADEIPLRQSFRLAHDWIESFALLAFNLLVGLCGLVIWWSLREQQEYLALAVWLLCNSLTVALDFAAHLKGVGPTSLLALVLVLVEAVSGVAELEFMRLLLRRERNWFWQLAEGAAFLAVFFQPLLESGRMPLRLAVGVVFVRPLITEVLVCLLLLRGVLRGNRDAPLLLLPVALWSIADVYNIVQTIVFFAFKVLWPELPRLHLFSYSLAFNTVATALGLVSLVLIILRRTIRLSRERADLASEVAAAEELQGLLMARASRPTPGYRVETAYRPMQEVGGDFFLVQPCEEDETVVAIVGDVSGKGLQAAMRVSLIMGVLQRETMGQPDRVLKRLNAALTDQVDFGFTTACCVRLERDGSFCFANAGHLNPYVGGVELPSEGALPLGMDADATYDVQRGRLLAGQRMMLLSDGVIEARDKKGELFGFERTLGLLQMDCSAVADVVQRFGQEDDITVLSLSLA